MAPLYPAYKAGLAGRLPVNEIKTEHQLKRSYEPIFDQTFAKLHVFSSLHGKPFLATRDDLLARLRGLLEIHIPKVLGVIDFERFKMG